MVDNAPLPDSTPAIAANPELVRMITFVFAHGLDEFLTRYEGTVNNADIFEALRQVFLHVAEVCTVTIVSEHPLSAYSNRLSIVHMLDEMKVTIEEWDIPTPVKH